MFDLLQSLSLLQSINIMTLSHPGLTVEIYHALLAADWERDLFSKTIILRKKEDKDLICQNQDSQANTYYKLRRLRNTTLELGYETQNLHLNDSMVKLKDSVYDEKFRKKIVSSAKKAYENMLSDYFSGEKPLQRNREQMKIDRESKKGSSHQWWEKSLESSYTTVIFVPPTPNGVLMKMMRNREKSLNENSKMKIKFIEKGSLFPRPWSPNKAAFFLLLQNFLSQISFYTLYLVPRAWGGEGSQPGF